MRNSLQPLMTSSRDDWETPPDLFQNLDDEFAFTVDAAASAANRLCSNFYGPDGLYPDALAPELIWQGRVFCNPPYGRLVGGFVERAILFVIAGKVEVAVLLLPARTDTKWFHYMLKHRYLVKLRFCRGRLKFQLNGQPILGANDKPVGAPFPSLLAIVKCQDWKWPEL